MTSSSQSAVQRFITSARELFAQEKDPAERWKKMTPLLEALIGDRSIKEKSKEWPACRQGDERAQNLLFYEDPDYKFVINGLIMRTTGPCTGCSTVMSQSNVLSG